MLHRYSSAYPVFFRTYSRKNGNKRESWRDVILRVLNGLIELGHLTKEEEELLYDQFIECKCLPSGRWLWVGGTSWVKSPNNYYGAYNCSSTSMDSIEAFRLVMNLAMQGCGTGAIVEKNIVSSLPSVKRGLRIKIQDKIGQITTNREEQTSVIPSFDHKSYSIIVGDSRQGWTDAYYALIFLATTNKVYAEFVNVSVYLGNVRPAGEPLKGFGGIANPSKLPDLFYRCASILNEAEGRNLSSTECSLLINEMARVVVAGNIRRSANIQQGDANDEEFKTIKLNLWQQDKNGNWFIDQKKDAMRMANLTRVFHKKPSLEEVIESVRTQYYSGEGAIQYAPEAIARANADLVPEKDRVTFIKEIENNTADLYLQSKDENIDTKEVHHRLQRYGLNPCVTGDTWIHTENGPRQVINLIGKQQGLYVNGKLYSTTKRGFFKSGEKAVYKLTTKEGLSLRLTANHKLLTIKHGKKEWVETGNLKQGDLICLHDHRGLSEWFGEGTTHDGWIIGNIIGQNYTSTFREINKFIQAEKEANSSVKTKQSVRQIIEKYTDNKTIKYKLVEQSSYKFYIGFLQGVFNRHATLFNGGQTGFISISLDLKNLQLIQRMLLRIGINSKIIESYNHSFSLIIENDNLDYFQKVINFFDVNKHKALDAILSVVPTFIDCFCTEVSEIYFDKIKAVYDCTVPAVSCFDANGFVAHNCGEIILNDNFCNLSEVHLNNIDPYDFDAQHDAFESAAIAASVLLHHKFVDKRYQYSRMVDPIVGISFTGLFDYFVNALGVPWLQWWEAGRPDVWHSDTPIVVNNLLLGVSNAINFSRDISQDLKDNHVYWFKTVEKTTLQRWKNIVFATVWDYCDRHGLPKPNRCTTVQPAGTKSLLTNASPGWHPPKSQRYIRRITFAKNDPVALACLDYGYSVIPAQSDRDEHGNLLNDPFDPRCTEWLVEVPTEVPWANLEGADQIDISKFSALAQFDFYMQVQRYYTTHNTSATIEFTEQEIKPLGTRIYEAIQNDEGYISAALLARFESNQTFPRLPFEPISKSVYDELLRGVKSRRKSDDFLALLNQYDNNQSELSGPAPCDSDKCLFPVQK